MPIGSTSTVDAYSGTIIPGKEVYTHASTNGDSHARTSTVSPEKASKHSKKRKESSEDILEKEVVAVSQGEEADGGKEKKHKKEKKNKKDKH